MDSEIPHGEPDNLSQDPRLKNGDFRLYETNHDFQIEISELVNRRTTAEVARYYEDPRGFYTHTELKDEDFGREAVRQVFAERAKDQVGTLLKSLHTQSEKRQLEVALEDHPDALAETIATVMHKQKSGDTSEPIAGETIVDDIARRSDHELSDPAYLAYAQEVIALLVHQGIYECCQSGTTEQLVTAVKLLNYYSIRAPRFDLTNAAGGNIAKEFIMCQLRAVRNEEGIAKEQTKQLYRHYEQFSENTKEEIYGTLRKIATELTLEEAIDAVKERIPEFRKELENEDDTRLRTYFEEILADLSDPEKEAALTEFTRQLLPLVLRSREISQAENTINYHHGILRPPIEQAYSFYDYRQMQRFKELYDEASKAGAEGDTLMRIHSFMLSTIDDPNYIDQAIAQLIDLTAETDVDKTFENPEEE